MCLSVNVQLALQWKKLFKSQQSCVSVYNRGCMVDTICVIVNVCVFEKISAYFMRSVVCVMCGVVCPVLTVLTGSN